MSAIGQSDAQAVVLLVDPVSCLAAIKGAQSIGSKLPLYGVTSCQSSSVLSATTSYKGKFFLAQASVSLASDDPDAKIYNDAIKKYGKQTDDPFHLVDGFETIMNLYAALKATPAPVTSASLVQTLSTKRLHAFLLGQNSTYICDGSILPATGAVCSAIAGWAEVTGGKLGPVTMINGAPGK
jgi:ABC-type branched-subunit amino acid transport system substrate-binding protein